MPLINQVICRACRVPMFPLPGLQPIPMAPPPIVTPEMARRKPPTMICETHACPRCGAKVWLAPGSPAPHEMAAICDSWRAMWGKMQGQNGGEEGSADAPA